MIVTPKIDIDKIGRGILEATLLCEGKRTITVMIKGGYKVNIMKKPDNLKNYDRIDFYNMKTPQTFLISDWQIKNLVFYTGKSPTEQEIADWRNGLVLTIPYHFYLRIKLMKEAYEVAKSVYDAAVRKPGTVETFGGYGIVAIDNINMSTQLSKIMKIWTENEPAKCHFIDKRTKVKRYALALEFNVDLESDNWRLNCVNPKIKAHEAFLDKLRSEELKVEKLTISVIETSFVKSAIDAGDYDE